MTAELTQQSELTRLVRSLLQELKRHVLTNTSLSVSVDYDDTPGDGMNIVAMATLPALALTGPQMKENRFYSTNEVREMALDETPEDMVSLVGPPLTEDLSFSLTAASESTVELLNLMAAVATFFNRNKWFLMTRDPEDPASERVHWEMDLEGDFRFSPDGPHDVRAFTCGFVIRGFDIDEGAVSGHTAPVTEVELQTEELGGQ